MHFCAIWNSNTIANVRVNAAYLTLKGKVVSHRTSDNQGKARSHAPTLVGKIDLRYVKK